MEKEKKEPTFLEQAFAIIEEHYADAKDGRTYGMTIMDHKLNCKILDAHERYIDEKIIEKFAEKVAEHYQPIMEKLNSIENHIGIINDDLIKIHRELALHESCIKQIKKVIRTKHPDSDLTDFI
jgi:uncharacterized protein (UPF0335 family)